MIKTDNFIVIITQNIEYLFDGCSVGIGTGSVAIRNVLKL